uniref:Uncharacterized protein n=1 Tax=Rhizophora mucronata TaxID=61149 RepID=A0A2P2N6S2_RHIMU
MSYKQSLISIWAPPHQCWQEEVLGVKNTNFQYIDDDVHDAFTLRVDG